MIVSGAVAPVIPLDDRTDVAGSRTSCLAASLPLAVVAVAALGFATQVNFGQFAPAAMAPLGASVVACVAAILAGSRTAPARVAWTVVGAALVVQFSMLLTQTPCATWPASADRELFVFRALVLAGAACTVAAIIARGRVATLAGVLLLLAYLAAGLCVLRVVPQPGVDVCLFQREGADALLTGRNPYAITFADPYGPASGFYGEDVVRDGRTTWGYPYPPLPLLMAIPGHLLGDFRLALLATTAASGALLLFMRPGSRLGVAAAALLLFTPRGFFVLEAGWIEPFVILGLAAMVYFAVRCRAVVSREDAGWRRKAPGSVAEFKPRDPAAYEGWLPLAIAAGLFLATKQYLALAVPLLWLLPAFRAAPRWKALAVVVIAGASVTLPLMLWDVRASVKSVVTLQFHQPFRPDALSFLVPLAQSLGRTPPTWIPFAAAAGVLVAALRRAPRTPGGFALATAAVFVVFFALNKQAFCNYYHFVIGALCCAIAAAEPLPPADRVRENRAA